MKKFYLFSLLITPFFILGQETCSHANERGHVYTHSIFDNTNNQIRSNATIPYVNSFESGVGDFTVFIAGEGTYNWNVMSGHFVHDDDAADGGFNYLQHDDVEEGDQVNWAISPSFDLSQAGIPTLRYWDHAHWQDYVGAHEVMYSTDYTDNPNTATWTLLTNSVCDNQNTTQSNPTNAWCNYEFILPTDSNVTLGFKYTGNFGSDWLIDDISLFDNSAAYANWDVSTAGTTATLSISDLNNFAVGTDGHWHYSVDGGDTVMVYDTNDVTISGLSTGDHTITAWLVDNDHNPLDPPVEETLTFTVTVINAYPWCDDFESGLGNWTSSIYSGTEEWIWGSQNLNGSVVPLSGAAMAGFFSGNYNNDTASIISPSMDLTGVDDPQLTFNYTQVQWAGDQDQLRVFYRSSVDGDWVQIGEYTEEVTAWTEITLDLPNPSSDYYVGFQATSGYGYGVTLDDVCVQTALSTNDNELLDMMVYPNPVDGGILTIQSPTEGMKEIEIYTVSGKKVMNTTINGNTLDVSSFDSGFYMLKVTINEQSKVSKLIIK